MCHDGLLACECLAAIAFILGFAFQVRVHIYSLLAIHDTIGCGMMYGDVTMNSFVFSCESCWYMTKSVTFLKLYEIQMNHQ